MIIHLEQDGQRRRTQFRSLIAVKRWATRYGHAWRVVASGTKNRVRDGVVIVSMADGTILRYSTTPVTIGGCVKPRRIQLRRTKGWRKPVGAVVVARPSRWGNPFQVVASRGFDARNAVAAYCVWLKTRARSGGGPPTTAEIRRELRGKDLCCWCPIGSPCHADVLLKIANGGGA